MDCIKGLVLVKSGGSCLLSQFHRSFASPRLQASLRRFLSRSVDQQGRSLVAGYPTNFRWPDVLAMFLNALLARPSGFRLRGQVAASDRTALGGLNMPSLPCSLERGTARTLRDIIRCAGCLISRATFDAGPADRQARTVGTSCRLSALVAPIRLRRSAALRRPADAADDLPRARAR